MRLVVELKHLCLLLVLFSKLPQAFLNDFSLCACASHSTLNLGMPLWSISISCHQFFYTYQAQGLFFSPNPSAGSSIQLHTTQLVTAKQTNQPTPFVKDLHSHNKHSDTEKERHSKRKRKRKEKKTHSAVAG